MQIFNTNTAKSALVGIYTLLFISFVVAWLYIGRIILMPLALAILLAFLLSSLVSWFEKGLGRVLAVLTVIILLSITIGFTGYILSKEFVRFTTNLAEYKTNIDAKIFTLKGHIQNVSNYMDTLDALKTRFSGGQAPAQPNGTELVDLDKVLLVAFEWIFGSFVSFLATTFLVLLLTGFILIDREDLRGRILRLIGQGRIGATTHALNDASQRLSRYLQMFLFINILYGVAVSIGLFILGIPNAALWGAFSALLRFIPYVGVWIAAAVPIALSFAISTSWLLPLVAIGLFVCLEAISFNILEPLLFGNTTGVSSIALIIAALFWTILWGPIGLILSTPLTVCLVVLGRYVPRLEFFSVLLSDEQPLALHEEYYHRLLVSNVNELIQLTETYLKDKPLVSLYDSVLIPVISAIEIDSRREILDEEQAHALLQSMSDIVEDLGARASYKKITSEHEKTSAADKKAIDELKKQHASITVICLPAKAKRDELAGEMLTQLLKQEFYNAINVPSHYKLEDIIDLIKSTKHKIIVISVIPPSTIIQARYLSRKMRSLFPNIKIMVGLWSYTENLTELSEGLFASGADGVVTTLADAVTYIENFKSKK